MIPDVVMNSRRKEQSWINKTEKQVHLQWSNYSWARTKQKIIFYLLPKLRLLISWNRSQQPVVILDYLHMSDLFSRQTPCAVDWQENSEVLADLTFGRRENKQNPDCIGGITRSMNTETNIVFVSPQLVGRCICGSVGCRKAIPSIFFHTPPMLVRWSIFPDVNGVLFRPQVAKKWLTALSIRGAVG